MKQFLLILLIFTFNLNNCLIIFYPTSIFDFLANSIKSSNFTKRKNTFNENLQFKAILKNNYLNMLPIFNFTIFA
jgi:hypothetical protein